MKEAKNRTDSGREVVQSERTSMGQKIGADKQRKLVTKKNINDKGYVHNIVQRDYSATSGIKCFYTNADQLKNKTNELNVRI